MNDRSNLYEAKTLMTGYRIGLKNPNLYIGVPEKNIKGGGCFAKFQGEVRAFSMDKCVGREKFNDKFKPGGTYTLCYFLWKRVSKGPIKEEGQEAKEAVAEVIAGVKVNKAVMAHQMSLQDIEEGNIK